MTTLVSSESGLNAHDQLLYCAVFRLLFHIYLYLVESPLIAFYNVNITNDN